MRCVSAMIPLDLPTANAKGRPIKVILSDRRVVIRVFTVGEEELLMFFGLGLLKPPGYPRIVARNTSYPSALTTRPARSTQPRSLTSTTSASAVTVSPM